MDSIRSLLFSNPVAATIGDVFNSFSDRRAKLGLPNPGSIENLSKEVQRDVFLNNLMFTGVRADLTRIFSLGPLFQVSHQFAMGERINPYTFAPMYGTSRVGRASLPPLRSPCALLILGPGLLPRKPGQRGLLVWTLQLPVDG